MSLDGTTEDGHKYSVQNFDDEPIYHGTVHSPCPHPRHGSNCPLCKFHVQETKRVKAARKKLGLSAEPKPIIEEVPE